MYRVLSEIITYKLVSVLLFRQDTVHIHPSLYPLLMVLTRLFPLEGADTSFICYYFREG